MDNICAIACQTVGSYHETLLARVVVASENKVYDYTRSAYVIKIVPAVHLFVRQISIITDYRVIKNSEIAELEKKMEDGLDIFEVRERVASAVHGKTLIGYFLFDDLKLLGINHPHDKCIDLANYGPIIRANGGQFVPFKILARTYLGKTTDESIDRTYFDAIDYFNIYKRVCNK